MTVLVDSAQELESRIWHILLLTVFVVLILTLALIGLQFNSAFDEGAVIFLSNDAFKYTIFLSIFILLFCSYVIANQRKLLLLSRAYHNEQTDRQTLSENIESLKAVFEISSVVNSEHSLASMLKVITIETVKCFDADQSSIMLTDQDANVIKTQAAYSKVGKHPGKDSVLPLGKSVAGWVAKKGSPLLLHGEVNEKDYPGVKQKQQSLNSAMCVPLKIRDKVIGVLNVNRIDVQKHFSEKDLQLVSIFANNASGAIYNASLLQRISTFNAQLEKKVQQRTLELEKANQAKSEFLASMSHELRTPLNSVIGFSQVLLKNNFCALMPKQEIYVNYILESGQHLLALINDILDLSKIEAGHFELDLSAVSVRELVEHNIEMLRPQADQKVLKLDIEWPQDLPELTLQADERRLKQVLLNLLNNAIKFTPEGGAISVCVRRIDTIAGLKAELPGFPEQARDKTLATKGPYSVISVTDSGVGIPPEEQEKIFGQFYQVKSGLQGKSPGTGLGLSVSKLLVERHNGAMWVYSQGQNKGSQFYVALPIQD